MKVSDIPKGSKILVPCVRCGYKRSVTFKDKATYEVQKTRQCHGCASEDIEYGGHFLGNRRQRKGGNPAFEDMN